MRQELARTLEEGFAQAELEDGRRALLQARKVARTTDGALAGRLAGYSVIGRTLKWDDEFEQQLAALTPAQVREALRRHLDPSKLSLVKAGDFTRVAAGKAE